MAVNKDKLIEAIHASTGNLTQAARRVGCSTMAIYNFRDRDEDVASAIEDSRLTLDAELLDAAESKLKQAQAGDRCRRALGDSFRSVNERQRPWLL